MSDDNSPVEEKKKGRGRPSATKKDVAVEDKKVICYFLSHFFQMLVVK